MSAPDLALVALGAIAVVASLAWLRRASPDDPDGRKGVLVALAVGLVAMGGGAWRALPERQPAPPAPDEPAVIEIDRDDDYRGGMPGGVFLAQHTMHMMRSPAHGFLWSPNGSTVWEVGWIVRAPRPGRYALWVRYASDTARPAEIWVNDRLVVARGLARTTPRRLVPEWFEEGAVELRAGANQLWFHREWPLPHIDAIRLVQPAPG